MSNDMVADDVNRCLRHELGDGLLPPVPRLRQRRPRHSDAHMLHAGRENARGFTSKANHSLEVFAAAFLADARQLAACTRGLAQQFRAIAYRAVCLGASGIDSP